MTYIKPNFKRFEVPEDTDHIRDCIEKYTCSPAAMRRKRWVLERLWHLLQSGEIDTATDGFRSDIGKNTSSMKPFPHLKIDASAETIDRIHAGKLIAFGNHQNLTDIPYTLQAFQEITGTHGDVYFTMKENLTRILRGLGGIPLERQGQLGKKKGSPMKTVLQTLRKAEDVIMLGKGTLLSSAQIPHFARNITSDAVGGTLVTYPQATRIPGSSIADFTKRHIRNMNLIMNANEGADCLLIDTNYGSKETRVSLEALTHEEYWGRYGK